MKLLKNHLEILVMMEQARIDNNVNRVNDPKEKYSRKAYNREQSRAFGRKEAFEEVLAHITYKEPEPQ